MRADYWIDCQVIYCGGHFNFVVSGRVESSVRGMTIKLLDIDVWEIGNR